MYDSLSTHFIDFEQNMAMRQLFDPLRPEASLWWWWWWRWWWGVFSHAKSKSISYVLTHHTSPRFGPLGVDLWLCVYFGTLRVEFEHLRVDVCLRDSILGT